MERLERYVNEMYAFRNDLAMEYSTVVDDKDIQGEAASRVFEDVQGYGGIYNTLLEDFSRKAGLMAMHRFFNDKHSRYHPHDFLLSFITHLYAIIDREARDKERLLHRLEDIYDDDGDDYIDD